MNPVYRKFTDQLAADAARAASAHPHSSAFNWLKGDWLRRGERIRLDAAPFGISFEAGAPFLIHDAASGMWLRVLSDPSEFGILIGLSMSNGEARFSGDVTIDGQPVRLRQTWRRLENAVEIRNERFTSGQWQFWDRALLERVTPAN